MPTRQISKATVREILRLHEAANAPDDIAKKLNLHRLEVAAILAHEQSAATARESSDLTEPIVPPKVVESVPATTVAERLDTEDEATEARSGIYVGEDVKFQTPIAWDPSDAQRVPNPHLMIMGESGSGKTYATQALVAELADAGVPSIVFDFGQSFELEKLDRSFLKYCKPVEHRIGEEGLSLNPLEIPPSNIRGPSQVATLLADVFDAAFQLGDIQKKVLIDAVMKLYSSAGISRDDKKSWTRQVPNIRALQDVIEELASDKSYTNVRNAAGLSARLTPFFMLSSFNDSQWSWDDLITNPSARVHVLQFRGLEGKTQRVLVELLLWHMFYHLKQHGQNSLRVFCVLDEAHHLSFRDSGPLYSLLREARKFGLGIIFASQQPEDFNPVAYSNSASKLVFQTADPKLKVSKFLAGKADNFDRPEDIRDAIGGLARGSALFISAGRGHVVRIAPFQSRTTQWQTL